MHYHINMMLMTWFSSLLGCNTEGVIAKLRLPSFRRCRKQHRWILFRFLAPLYQKMVRCIRRRKTTEKTKDAPHSAGAKANLCDLGTLFGNYQRDPSLLLPIIFGDSKNLGILETKFWRFLEMLLEPV